MGITGYTWEAGLALRALCWAESGPWGPGCSTAALEGEAMLLLNPRCTAAQLGKVPAGAVEAALGA